MYHWLIPVVYPIHVSMLRQQHRHLSYKQRRPGMLIPKNTFILLSSILLYILQTKRCFGDGSSPLSTQEFYKQIYRDVCPSGELSCLREIMTGNFQLSLPRNKGQKSDSETIKLFDDKEHTVKTLSQYPPIFEIEDFFTEEECELAIDLANAKGLKRSPMLTNPKTMFKDEKKETFKMWNLNGDDFIDANEVAYVYGKAGIFITEGDVLDMFINTGVDSNEDGKLDQTEFEDINKENTEEFFADYISIAQESGLNNAFTQQTWLWHDEDELLAYEDIFENYHERIAKLTKLPQKIVEHSEPIQVVKYENDAHYECHHDTQSVSKELPCCQYGATNCRLCRYLTIMVYLNDNFEGGEKCFPFADNETFSQKDLPREYLKKCNLAKSCEACNVVIKPKKGKAVIWYNHLLSHRTGWMGALDAFSGHGDCKSRNGKKWIANIWIDIIGDGKHELRSWKSGTNWIKPGNKDIEIYSTLGNPDLKPKPVHVQFKERYSEAKNKMPQTNVKIGDIKLHFNNINKPNEGSSVGNIGPEQDTASQSSRIVQSIILLLEELNQKELDIVAEVIRSKMQPFTISKN